MKPLPVILQEDSVQAPLPKKNERLEGHEEIAEYLLAAVSKQYISLANEHREIMLKCKL
jgi:hypothetical protein